MNFFSLSLPFGRFAGISVRIHFTFFIGAFFMLQQFGDNVIFGSIVVIGYYFSILLHEFGHALGARWCDGEADQIILWPMGGLAFCRPLFNPTANLITSVGGPFVSLLLAILFFTLHQFDFGALPYGSYTNTFILYMLWLNGTVLLFNLIPAFPMDGGRILRDILWYWFGVSRATNFAVILSKVISIAAIAWSAYTHHYWIAMIALFIFFQSSAELMTLEWSGPVQPFSILERWKRKKRSRPSWRPIIPGMAGQNSETFHRCVICGKTELDSQDLIFRVASDGEEYCLAHLPRR